MQERMFWPLTTSFLVLLAVFFLAVDTSQNGDLSNWLRTQVGPTTAFSGLSSAGPAIAFTSIDEVEFVETMEIGTPPTVPVHFVSHTTAVRQEPVRQSGTTQETLTAHQLPIQPVIGAVNPPMIVEPTRPATPRQDVSLQSDALAILTQESVGNSSTQKPAAVQQPPLTLPPRKSGPTREHAGSTIDLPPDDERTAADSNHEPQPIPASNPVPLQPLPPKSKPKTNSASSSSESVQSDKNAESADGGSDNSKTETADTIWPMPEELIGEVVRAGQHGPCSSWSESTVQTLESFPKLKALDDPYIEFILSQLANQINELEPIIVAASTVPVHSSDLSAGAVAEQLRTLRQRLIQYWSISGSVYRVAVLSPGVTRRNQSLVPVVRVSNVNLRMPTIEKEWARYLAIEELQKQIDASPIDVEARRNAAQKFLSRLTSPVLTAPQNDFLRSNIDQSTVDAVREFAFEPVDLREMLINVDEFTRTGHGYYASKLAGVMQGLTWQTDEPSQLLAKTLDEQLRGANLRISVSDEMLNRLLPETPEISEPVNENMMGADVRGHSRIANRLQIRLIPDAEQIQMRLESIGLVRSRTKAFQKGFEVDNVGDSNFQVFKRLTIGRNGILADRPAASASSSSQVVGMKSKYDGMPIIGHIARRMAQKQIDEQTPTANRLVEKKLETEVSKRFDQEIDTHLFDLQDYLAQNLVEPLTALELEPTPLEMRSTDDRIIMQYRMAGRDQLTASSSRPMGLHKSLMSMQIHESLINNMLARIDLAGQIYTGEELSTHLGEVFGFQAQPDERFSDAEYQLQFSAYHPVAIHFEDKTIVIELNIRGFKVNRGKTWRNFVVRATYHPEVVGDQLRLVQSDAGISLKGSSLGGRDQAALRLIFSAMFHGQYNLALLPMGITERLGAPVAVSQFELSEGWLAMSIDDQFGPASAIPRDERPQGQHSHLSDQDSIRR